MNRNGPVEAVVAQINVCTVFMSQWAASGKKQDEERYGQIWELLGQGKQYCSGLL